MLNETGSYRFAPGIGAYSGGVAADGDVVIHHVSFRERLGWRAGFEAIKQHLDAAGRAPNALCAVELRCPRPHPFDGFGSFNQDYRDVLASWGLLLDEDNPVARTNVAPVDHPPSDTELHAFSYTSSGPAEPAGGGAASFVIAGAGDLADQSDLRPEAIVAPGDRSDEGMTVKANCVLKEMEARLSALGVGWPDVDVVNVYTNERIQPVIAKLLAARVGTAAGGALTWYPCRPPIEGLDFEMDVRGGCVEYWI